MSFVSLFLHTANLNFFWLHNYSTRNARSS